MAARWLISFGLALWLWLAGAAPVNAAEVWVVEIEGAITPAAADLFGRALDDARDAGAAALVMRLDTPGGLDSSMRDMIKRILASRVPVVVFVAPNGSRAASAGTYLLFASHVAAMAPATNVGSSTPVSISGRSPFEAPSSEGEDGTEATGSSTMERKVINDAVAYIRGLAELRGRNAEWAEQTVREAANLPASEALANGVIDLVVEDLNALLEALDGRRVEIQGGTVTLAVADAEVVMVEPGWRYEFLSVITDPNVAYILLMIGIYGLILEFYSPGFGLPGVAGVICLLLGAYALQMLPISYAGLALILVGIALMVGEAITPTFGVLGVGGVIAFVAGSVMLFDSELPAYGVSIPIVAAVAVASAALFMLGLAAAGRARRLHVVTGREAMVGSEAVALEDFAERGRVRAFSENWLARSPSAVRKGDRLRITGIDGLVLFVQPEE